MTELLDSLKSAVSDRYTIERELGRGGVATVYLAHDFKLNRKVALRVLSPEGAILSDQIKSLDWRARSASRLTRVPPHVMNEITARIPALVDPE